MRTLVVSAALALYAIGVFAQDCPGTCPTSDDTSVQALLDAAAAAGGGTVQLEARVYKICSPLIVGSDVHLRGAGRGATIIRTKATITGKVINNAFIAASIAAVGASNVTISDLTVDHATCTSNANGIALMPSGVAGQGSQEYNGTTPKYGLIERVEVLGTPGPHAYMIWNLKGEHIKIVGNWVNGNSTTTSSQEGIETFGGKDVLIADNTVRNIGYACLNIGSAGLQNTETVGVVAVNNNLAGCAVGINLGTSMDGASPRNNLHTLLRGNVITNCRQVGIDVPVTIGTQERDLEISGNTIRDINASGAAGIRLRANGSPYTLAADAIVANTISGNVIGNIRGSNAHGIRVSGYPNARILNNTVVDTDNEGIYVADSNDVEIAGNRVERPGTAGIAIWKSLAPEVARPIVERNVIRDWSATTAGILVIGAKRGTVKDNVFKRDTGTPNPIVFDVSSCGVTVNGNVQWYLPTWTEPTTPGC